MGGGRKDGQPIAGGLDQAVKQSAPCVVDGALDVGEGRLVYPCPGCQSAVE